MPARAGRAGKFAAIRARPAFLGRAIAAARLQAAVAGAFFHALTLAAGVYAPAATESTPPADLLFEAASALGTVGLSRGVTGSLTPAGQAIVIALMFVGRVGPLAPALALVRPAAAGSAHAPTEDMAL